MGRGEYLQIKIKIKRKKKRGRTGKIGEIYRMLR
jgi:hypothetical protein